MKQKNGLLSELCEELAVAEKKLSGALRSASREIRETVETVKERDPAARSTAEVLLLYSGVHAIMAHRVAHKLYKNGKYQQSEGHLL